LKLEKIPVVALATPAPAAMLSGNATVLLREISERVRQLLDDGQSAIIDLLALPLNAADLDWLRTQLGSGEVRATLDADGESVLQETQCPGVWWVQHHNPGGGVMSAFIEITPVPDLLRAHPDDIRGGQQRLTRLLEDLG